jgi:hypothetical protein
MGGNDSTVTTELIYDRVESSHVKEDTRAARCKSWAHSFRIINDPYNICAPFAQPLKVGLS